MGPTNPFNIHQVVADSIVWSGIGYLTGYAWGKLTNASPKQCALIFAISQFADNVLFSVTSVVARKTDFGNLLVYRVYAYTSTTVHIVSIIAMYHFNLIGLRGTLCLTGVAMLNLLKVMTLYKRSLPMTLNHLHKCTQDATLLRKS